MKNERGVIYLETLIGFLPTFLFFLATLQVADASVAHLVMEHAATTAVRAAVVVLPDDGAYYEDLENALVDQNRDWRQSDVERAADTILAANPRLGLGNGNVSLDKPAYQDRELVTARVTAPYRCLVRLFCPGGISMSASAQLVYQGARYQYEPSIGWATSAANRAADRVRTRPNLPDPAPNQEPGGENNGRPTEENPRPDDESPPPEEHADGPTHPSDPRPGDPDARPQPGDTTTEPNRLQPPRNEEALRRALPRNLRNVPIVRDPSLRGSTVRVHYTHDARGVITGIEVRVGDSAGPRHIADHAATIRVMQRYQGVSGRARALLGRINGWLTGHPGAGPGTLAWETRREIEKLNGIIDARARQLEDPALTPQQRAELERELASYEEQLEKYQAAVDQVVAEPGRGYVAADDTTPSTSEEDARDARAARDSNAAQWGVNPDTGEYEPGRTFDGKSLTPEQIDDLARSEPQNGEPRVVERRRRYLEQSAGKKNQMDVESWLKSGFQVNVNRDVSAVYEQKAVAAVGGSSNNAAGTLDSHDYSEWVDSRGRPLSSQPKPGEQPPAGATLRTETTRPDGVRKNPDGTADIIEHKHLGEDQTVYYDDIQLRAQREMAAKYGGTHELVISSARPPKADGTPDLEPSGGITRTETVVKYYDIARGEVTHVFENGVWDRLPTSSAPQ